MGRIAVHCALIEDGSESSFTRKVFCSLNFAVPNNAHVLNTVIERSIFSVATFQKSGARISNNDV